MHCSYTELTHDVAHNRIIKSTLYLLYREAKLNKDLKKSLHQQVDAFTDVKHIHVTPRSFQRIQLHRNNRDYRFIPHLCELIHASLLPEHDSNGRRKFRRIEENKDVMPYIFENFVLAFARRHQPQAKSHRPTFPWLADFHTVGSESLMPRMMTDMAMEWKKSGRKLILDCKYYKQASSKRSYNEELEIERF